MATTAAKSERLNLRIDEASKETLERAATYAGSKLTDFVLTHALAAANQVIRNQHAVALSKADWDALFEALEHPPEPNERLKRALERHDALYG